MLKNLLQHPKISDSGYKKKQRLSNDKDRIPRSHKAGNVFNWAVRLSQFYLFCAPVVVIILSLNVGTEAEHGRDLWSFIERAYADCIKTLEYGYLGCVLILLRYALSHRDKTGRLALLFAGLGILSMLVLYPMAFVPKTK